VKGLERTPPNIKFNENSVTSLRVVASGKAGMVKTKDVCATFCCEGAKTL
jgi:hypothetical protein